MENELEGRGMSLCIDKLTQEMKEKYPCAIRVVDIGQSWEKMLSEIGQHPANLSNLKQKQQKGKNRRSFHNR